MCISDEVQKSILSTKPYTTSLSFFLYICICGSTVILLDLSCFLSFLILYTAATYIQNKQTQIFMPSVGFEPTIPAFEREKRVHTLDLATTVIGLSFLWLIQFWMRFGSGGGGTKPVSLYCSPMPQYWDA
jgi:hypothetical protein